MDKVLDQWEERAANLSRLCEERERELKNEIRILRRRRPFDRTVWDLISEIAADSETMYKDVEGMNELLGGGHPAAVHLAHGLKEKSDLLLQAYRGINGKGKQEGE